MTKILIAAGGSGGHLFPAQQLAEMLLKTKKCDLLFAGYKLGETPFLAREKIPFVEIPASPLNRLKFPFVWVKGFLKSWQTIRSFQPDVVVGFGSYHVFPVLCAAAALKKKMVLYEANCALGKVNRFFAPMSKTVAVQFPQKTGTLIPLFPWVVRAGNWSQKLAREHYRLDPELLTFLVFGGSQGAQFLNVAIPAALARIPSKIQVIHLTGKDRDAPVRKAYEDLKIKAYVAGFEPDMAIAYAAADCAICRSGAGTIAELIRNKLAALLIPFPAATDDHQRINAEYLLKTEAARLLIQSEAHLDRLVDEIKKLVFEREEKRLSLQKIDLHNGGRSDFAKLVLNIGEL